MKNSDLNRRNFIKTSVTAGLAFATVPGIGSALNNNALGKKTTIGIIGVGVRGRKLLDCLVNFRNDVEVSAICDIDPKAINLTKEIIKKAGGAEPEVYSGDELAWQKMLKREDLEGVIIATPWVWHTPMAVEAMRAGIYAGVEVPSAFTLEECWDLVNTYEETGTPCMIMENECYRRDIMAVLNMVRQGLFGELIHFRSGYQHDMRNGVLFKPGVTFGEEATYEARWRTNYYKNYNRDLYPTHGVGPLAMYSNINRGNRFVSITSTATKARGIRSYILNHPQGGESHPNAQIEWEQGDIVTSVISTANGENIILSYDTTLPRPHTMGFWVQGVKGIAEFDLHQQRIFLEGTSKNWEGMSHYLEKYDHPLWKRFANAAEGTGHGGMDFFVCNAFVEIVKNKLEAPMDVYDAAAWSVIGPLSGKSVEEGGAPQHFPDFTRGKWMNRKVVFALDDKF